MTADRTPRPELATYPLLILPLKPSLGAAASVRRHLSALPEISNDVAEGLALVSTELVNNAVRHAGTDLCYRLQASREGLLVQVDDYRPNSRPRLIGLRSPVAPGGRGLHVVDALSQSRGCFVSPTGLTKTVWVFIAWP